MSLLLVSFVSAGTNIFRMRGESGPLLDPRIIETLGEVDRTEALAAIEEALQQSPQDTSLLLARATVHALGQDWENAIEDYRAVLAADPNDYRALNNLAWLLLEEAPAKYRDMDEATRLAERAVAAAPDDPYSAGTLGTARLRGGDAAGAVEYLTRALAVPRPAPSEATDRFLLATALAKLGRTKEATEALRVAVQQDPRNDYRSEAERALAGNTHSDSAL
jgi:tetratricopeptide (TPR) repeat protein